MKIYLAAPIFSESDRLYNDLLVSKIEEAISKTDNEFLEILKEAKENIEALDRGTNNLFKHIENIKEHYGLNVIVAINKYVTDSIKEIESIYYN